MDPNPKEFPIRSHVMARNPQLGSKPATTDSHSHHIDIEQPALQPDGSNSNKSEAERGELTDQMPQLNHPKILASMTLAISEVAHARSILQTLGDRPDHESVDVARAKISEIESNHSNQFEEIVLTPGPDDVDPIEWRTQKAEKEREIYEAVVKLDEMHEEYENMLRDAEERLVKIYGSASEIGEEEEGLKEKECVVVEEEEVMNEEVVGILREALENGLERVELSGRDLRFLPEAFGKLRGVVVLNLSSNQLEAIPDSIAGLKILEELNLSSNLLELLPDSIGLLLNLKILNVSSNKLKALPDSISHCRSLVELNASYNGLTYLPTKIGYELVNLRSLSVHLNKIRSLPTSICEMRSLTHLDAHFNELHGLPNAIGRLLNLEILNLSSNFSDLTELPDTIGDLTNLKELDISNNQIHALPNTFGRLDNLTKLNLDQNPLVVPPMEIVNQGVEAIKEYMSKRWYNILVEEEQKSMQEPNNEAQSGWLTRSTSWLNNWASVVSESVNGYLGGGVNSPRDPYLDQQL